MRGRIQRAARLAPVLIGPWAVLVFGSARLTGVGPQDGSWTADLWRSRPAQ